MKTYTVADLSAISGLTVMGVFARARRLGIKPYGYEKEKTSKGNSIKISLFSYVQVVQMGFFGEKKAESKVEVKPLKFNLEELKKLHPLVKDMRFFKTSYFPDIIPDCYKETEK